MERLRQRAKKYREFVKEHAESPDAPAVAVFVGDSEHTEWTKIALLLLREDIGKPLRHLEDYLNEMPRDSRRVRTRDVAGFHLVLRVGEAISMRTLRRMAEQADFSGTGAIDASGFQRGRASHYYRKRAGYSFQATKTTILVDTDSLAIMDVNFTTKRAYDWHIGLQVFQRNAGDLRELLADKMYSWRDLREKYRNEATRPVIKHCEQSSLQKAHNARIDDDLYNQRSMSGTVFSMLKADDGESLHTRTRHGQFRELARKCIVHNLSRAVG
jgi:IS5 family transposase